MRKAKHFMLLFWKNWTLGKRSPIRTLFEICLPLFYIVLLVLLRAFVVKDKPKDQRQYTQFTVSSLPNGLVPPNSKPWKFAFSPNTSDVESVIKSATMKLGKVELGPYSGFKTEEEMVSFLVNAPPTANYLGGVYFVRSPDHPNVEFKLRLSSRARNSKKKKIRNFGGDPTTAWNTQFTFPVFQVPGPRKPNMTYGGPPDYYDEGFLCLQNAIDESIIEYKTVAGVLNNVTTGLRRYPYPAYMDDPFILVIQQTFPLLLMLSLVVTALYIVKDIVHEKERKLKESLKMMGLPGWLHWTAWFTKYLLFLLVTVILASILFTTKFNDNGRILNKSDGSVIFVFLLLFSISSIMFCFCVSVFFSKASIAAAAGGIIWFCSYIPYFFVAQSYDTMSLGLKLVSCLLSNCAMGMGALLIGKFEGRGTGVQWGNINDGVSVDDSMTLGLVMWMMVADSLLYGIVTWYIEAVFPGEYGTPQRWYFPCLPSYWCGKNVADEEDSLHANGYVPEGAAPDFLEKEPARLHAGVEVRNLKKVFSTETGKKTAVDRVSLNMYEGQITALLGHNGAGKTTLMSILTGLFPPSSGTAIVNGCSITDDMPGVRSSLGLCPQHDVIFDRLTVSEHLWMFGLLKGCLKRRVQVEVDSMIRRIGLVDKRDTQARALSGGMKRKLSVGIALIGDSKVVMLDEPTSGMDPSARRFTWNLLQQERQGRTILLTTHFMDEADLLGDRIAIMAEGHIKCCGSSLFLKNRYGVGYHMAIVKASNCNVSRVTEVVQSFVPTAQLESNVGAELSYVLPSEATGKFEELFTELETRKVELGIASFGASVTTMEEVFLKVGEEVDDSITKVLQQNDQESEDRDSNDEHTIAVKDTNRLGLFSAASGAHGSAKRNCRFKLGFQRWYAMFVKRLLHSKRHKLSIVSQLLLPLIFTLFALINAKTFPQPQDSPALPLNASTFGQGSIVLYGRTLMNGTSTARELSEAYKNQFKDTNSRVELVKGNMSDFLISEAKKLTIGDFNLHHLIAATFNQQKTNLVNITAWFNNQAYHSTAISLAAVHDGLLKSVLGRNHSISTINHPLPRTTKDSIDDLSRNGLGFLISFNMLFGMAFLASSFVVFLVQERSNKAKHVQFVSGVTPVSYWTSAYLWDLINFLVPVLSLLILLAAFDVPAYSGPRLGYTFILLMLYGWAIIPLMYIFSFVFRTAANAFVLLTIFNIITGLATLLTVFILSIHGLDLLDVADALKWAFLVLPNYCLGQGIGDIFSNYDTITIFNEAVDACLKDVPGATREMCEEIVKKIAGSRLQFQDNYLAWDNPGIGRYLIFLSGEGIIFFLFVLVLEYGVFRRFWLLVCRRACQPKLELMELNSSTCTAEDDDVFEEKRRIAACSGRTQDVLVISDLTKVYRERIGSGPLLAVDNLSVGIPLGECFGLLGINGAGKTTTFRMLTGDETMTSGTASVDGYDIRSNMNQVRQRIGYCPQFDALIEQMTGRELLYMYARLRGVTEADIPESVNDLVHSLLLSDHVDKLTKNLSGGNKRKLSTAIALVGDPPVVFLDEPTTGMDPVARRLLWDALSRVRAEGRCIVITSHSMEECDALCTRLAIMVNGRFKCLGSPQHLKTKFGQGFTLLAKVGGVPPDTGPLKTFIEGAFPGSILKDEHLGMVHYHITDTSISWAEVFGTIERNKLEYDIEDYSVSQTTLEQVFLNFARGQRQDDL